MQYKGLRMSNRIKMLTFLNKELLIGCKGGGQTMSRVVNTEGILKKSYGNLILQRLSKIDAYISIKRVLSETTFKEDNRSPSRHYRKSITSRI